MMHLLAPDAPRQGEVDLVGVFFELEQRLQSAAAAAARPPGAAPPQVPEAQTLKGICLTCRSAAQASLAPSTLASAAAALTTGMCLQLGGWKNEI